MNLPSYTRKAIKAMCVSGISLTGGPEKPFNEPVNVGLDSAGSPTMIEMPEPAESCLEKQKTRCGTSPRSLSSLQSTKLKGVRNMNDPLTAHMEM